MDTKIKNLYSSLNASNIPVLEFLVNQYQNETPRFLTNRFKNRYQNVKMALKITAIRTNIRFNDLEATGQYLKTYIKLNTNLIRHTSFPRKYNFLGQTSTTAVVDS